MAYSWEFVIWALVLIVLFKNQQKTIYYMKFTYFYVAFMGIVTLLIPYYLLHVRNVKNFFAASAGVKHISKVIGITWTLRGVEHVSKEEACVVVANHQSSLDMQGMFDMWPVFGKMTAIAKRELLMTGTFGISMYLAGLTFINRKAGASAAKAMNDTVEELKAKKTKLWVFPEGTRRNTGEIHQFKKGAFHAAIHAQVPIVPVVFSSHKSFLDMEKKMLNKGEVIVTILPEIPTKGLTSADVDSLIEKTRSAMIEVYNKTSQEISTKLLSTVDDDE